VLLDFFKRTVANGTMEFTDSQAYQFGVLLSTYISSREKSSRVLFISGVKRSNPFNFLHQDVSAWTRRRSTDLIKWH